MITTIDGALERLDQMMADAEADGIEGDEAYSDLVDAVILDCDAGIVSEFKRVTRGW
jgi:hypothetical protein